MPEIGERLFAMLGLLRGSPVAHSTLQEPRSEALEASSTPTFSREEVKIAYDSCQKAILQGKQHIFHAK